MSQDLFAAVDRKDVAAIAAAVAAAEEEGGSEARNAQGQTPLMVAAATGDVAIVEALLEAGAVWNAVDGEGKTAGDHAKGEAVYKVLVDAGVRAQLFFSMMERMDESADEDAPAEANDQEGFLSRPLRFVTNEEGHTTLLSAEGDAVMMGWEAPLMVHHAKVIGATRGDVLNVGFGLGLIDEELQKLKPRSHTIIEAHPDVYRHMIELGWDKKPGVKIFHGRWQDVLPKLGQFDGIFFDTFSEHYEEMQQFHDHLPNLLRADGVYSYFCGLAASTNRFFHDVARTVCELELLDIGLHSTYDVVPIDSSDPRLWEGVKRKYWVLDTYHVPRCTFS